MTTTAQIAKHFREVHTGGNWTWVNLKDTLEGINWQQATTKVHSFNTIATLVFHINYYTSVVLKVLNGAPLDASDKFSFDLPPITCEEDWQQLKDKTFSEAEQFATRLEALPDDTLWQDFFEGKYGNYFRNMLGIIEHTHYHLGQITLLKKLVTAT